MSDAKGGRIEALQAALEAKDELIEALTAKADAFQALAEARKAQIERLNAELLEEQTPGFCRRREDCANCAPCPCAEDD